MGLTILSDKKCYCSFKVIPDDVNAAFVFSEETYNKEEIASECLNEGSGYDEFYLLYCTT